MVMLQMLDLQPSSQSTNGESVDRVVRNIHTDKGRHRETKEEKGRQRETELDKGRQRETKGDETKETKGDETK